MSAEPARPAAGNDAAPRVQIVDPSAYTPPYDRALCAALASAGAEVELVTSRFLYGTVPEPNGYRVTELFYRRWQRRPASRARLAAKLAQHPLDMHRLSQGSGLAIPNPDLRHFQWLSVPQFDRWALRRLSGPLVLTAHDVLPREPRPGQIRGQRRLYDAVDAVIAHTEHGRRRLTDELGVDAAKVRVIEPGAFDYLTELREERPLEPALGEWLGDRPVALFFGLMRPYKGLDVLLDAWGGVRGDARLVIAGMPRMGIAPLEARADDRVRLIPRFITDAEIPALFRRAQLVVLPYWEIEQSGVLYTAFAFGKATVLSRVGGFIEVGDRDGAARLVAPGDPDDLAGALSELLFDPAGRERLEEAARRAASERYSWREAARRHLELYAELAA